MPLFLIALYTKSEKIDMTPAEKKAATKLVQTLKQQYENSKRTAPVLQRLQGSRKGRR